MRVRNRSIVVVFIAVPIVAVACAANSPMPDASLQPVAQVRTADTDALQSENGVVDVDVSGKVVIAGPIVITDIWEVQRVNTQQITMYSDTSVSCNGGRPGDSKLFLEGITVPIHGVRIAVRSADYLCARAFGATGARIVWSGYAPYNR